ncbi:MAG: RnfABCDGE type electron transport complex subunit B [bacterium]|nr:RnfABCDGE type electron transport complex subunit B [bacterium]
MWFHPLIVMSLFGGLFGAGLAYASRKFAVKTDPRVAAVLEALPGVNCGACGYPGCAGYAEAVVSGKAAPSLCAPGGAEVTEAVCAILGVTYEATEPRVAYVMCQGAPHAQQEAQYDGVASCALAALVSEGPSACKYACVMMGDCYHACPFGAISWQTGSVPVIDEAKCTACRKCIAICPKEVIALRYRSKRVLILCHSQDKGAVARKKCAVACIACTKCVQTCPVHAIRMDGNLAVLDTGVCTQCGACVKVCPTGAIRDLRPTTNEENLARAGAGIGVAAE